MKLSIVIPALNEEGAIASIIERCIAERPAIIKESPVTEVDIVVVSDGSTDKTPEIAGRYKEVDLIIFEQNRGYGAAIKTGWEKSGGDLLAFLDADGTCDPHNFILMCNLIEKEKADVVIGSRMGKSSKMPAVRRLGNTIFVTMLGFLSRKNLTDSASGMRVVRKSSLPGIYPLPDGLHFTPAMSAKILMDDELVIKEIDMHYEERIGESKLHVLKDGLRFLRVILSAAAYIKPSRITMPVNVMLVLCAVLLCLVPLKYYLQNHGFLDWMIYRFVLIFLLGTASISIFCTTIIAEHFIALTLFRLDSYKSSYRPWWGKGGFPIYLTIGAILFVAAIVLLWPGIIAFFDTGHVSLKVLHWSRLIVASFFIFNFMQFIITGLLLQLITALNQRQPYLTGNK